jgi:transcriptional regulator GlxA family with amidase domain
MRSIAERAITAVFAAAEIDGAIFFGGVGSGSETRALMRAIAEWLRRTPATGAPVVGFSSFDSDRNR